MRAEYFVVLYALLLALRDCPVDSEGSCTLNQKCTAIFIYSSLQLIGCSALGSNFSSTSVESLNCLRDTQCKALICNISTASCSSCTAGLIQSINFTTPGIYLKRAAMMLNRTYDRALLGKEEKLILPDGLMPGDLIYLKATLLNYDNFYVNLVTKNGDRNFHMKARCDNNCANTWSCEADQCSRKYLVMTSYVNGLWDTSGSYSSYSYPYIVNEVFEIHLLIQLESVTVYVNKTFLHNFTTPLSTTSVSAIAVGGTIKVHELSV